MFNLISLLFIFSNFYFIYHYKRLDEPIRVRDYSKKLDLVYYISKPVFFIWVLVGIMFSISNIYLYLGLISFLRIPIYYTNKSIYSRYHRLIPVLNLALLILLLFGL